MSTTSKATPALFRARLVASHCTQRGLEYTVMSTGRCLSRGAAPTARGAFLVLVGPGGPKTVPFAPGPSMTPASVAFDEAAGPRKGWIAAAPPTLHLVVGAWNDHKMY